MAQLDWSLLENKNRTIDKNRPTKLIDRMWGKSVIMKFGVRFRSCTLIDAIGLMWINNIKMTRPKAKRFAKKRSSHQRLLDPSNTPSSRVSPKNSVDSKQKLPFFCLQIFCSNKCGVYFWYDFCSIEMLTNKQSMDPQKRSVLCTNPLNLIRSREREKLCSPWFD
jgi:hypothetical protein